MYVSGVAIHARHASFEGVLAQCIALEGVEVHAQAPEQGRAVLTIEADSLKQEVALAETLRALPGVVDLQMVFHAFDDDPAWHKATPIELIAERLS
jgi:nitrate reductase NapD